MTNRLACLLVASSCLAAVNVPLTIREALYPGSTSGIARTNEPLTVGVPLPDSAGITSTSVLGLMGAAAAQFSVEGKWPDGHIKWVKVRAIVPSIAAGKTATVTLTDSGSGNFGGSDLAADTGSTITVSTGTATFTIRKAHFNGVDQVVIGSATIVASGVSQGFVVLGPDPAATYPANVTCLPTPGGSPCGTVYSSANDPNSTAVIEENGPAATVIKATGSHVDSSGHTYMHFTARLYFFKNQNYVKVTSILRNADYGTSKTFATAFKGFQGYELRVTPGISGALNYTIANDSASPTTGILNAADSAYIYQAESTLMTNNDWCKGSGCVPYTSLKGYSIVKNGSSVKTGSAGQHPKGWADIRNSSGEGIEIGQYQFAGYGNKSLEFDSGGADVRIGIWARENNTTGTASTTANRPYYMPWPQWSINDVYLNFHAGSDASLSNDFLKLQHYLVAAAAPAYYNNCNVFIEPLLDPTEETNYYSSVASSARPRIAAPLIQDLGTIDTYNWPLTAWRFYPWAAGGVTNQMEFRLAHVQDFLRRGFTGGYLDSAHFYKLVAEKAFPMSDGFNWRTSPPGETQYVGYPIAASTNKELGMKDWVEADEEHSHWYGMPDYYFLSGDETIHDAIIEGPKDSFMNNTSAGNGTTSEVSGGWFWAARSVGAVLMSDARLFSFLQATGDPDAGAIAQNGQTVYNLQIQPDFCAVPGYPAGCTPDPLNDNSGYGIGGTNRQRGVSRVRGIPYQWGDTIKQAGCPTNPKDVRDQSPFMVGILLQGLWEFRQAMGPGWADYNQAFDLGYGISQWALSEMYADNGSAGWQGNGFRYKEAVDYPNACNVGAGGAVNDYYWMVQNPNAFWPIFFFRNQYEGGTTAANLQRQFNLSLQNVISGGTAIRDELYHYTIGEMIYAFNHPSGESLNTVPITGFTSNGSSYTITWSVPAGATSYRIKWGPRQIVDWIGFDPASNTFVGNPATTMNWFAATDAAGIPAPAGSTQSLTIMTGVAGLKAENFMVKAYTKSAAQAPARPALAEKPYVPSASHPTPEDQSTGPGTSIPNNTWTMIHSKGWPVEILNYDKSEYISSRKLHCIWGAYKQYLSSEHNNAIVCYSFPENRWHVLENNGYWHSSHSPGAGHTVSIWAYMSDKDTLAFQTDGSGSNSPEEFIGLWWWYDIGGLSGQNREFSPRPWLGVQTPLVEMMTYDPYDQKLILYDKSGSIEVCDPDANRCSVASVHGTAPPKTLTSGNMVYSSANHEMYVFGGGQANMYTLACATKSCTALTGSQLPVTCTGADCANGKPPARMASGMAYSTSDNVFLMVGGINRYGGNSAFHDTWTFNPATNEWTESSPASNYSTTAAYFTADRLTYDQDSNTFLLMSINGYTPVIYVYPYSNALNYGRVTTNYAPPAGSLNRVAPTPDKQSWAFDPAIAASNGDVYAGWIETGAPGDESTCGETHHPYLKHSANSVGWKDFPALGKDEACLAIDPELEGNTNDSKLHLAIVGGSLWEAHEKINGNQNYNSAAFASSWTGSAWKGGAVGCFSAKCGASLRQHPEALIAVGNTPTLATLEQNHATYTPEEYLFVSQWNGSAWAPLGGKLNVSKGGTQALEAALAADGTNPAACWSEQVVAADRSTVSSNPQIECAQWDGAAWARWGSRSLNRSSTSWASEPSLTYVGGKFYVGWLERTTAGVNQLYVCRWDGSSCTLLGGGALNLAPATGWAAHPSMANDGANVYVAWEEQAAQGKHSMGYVKAWNGSSWSQLGDALNADPTNGSVEGITLTVAQGKPTAIWAELTYGSLRQAYAKQWNGSAWKSLGDAPAR